MMVEQYIYDVACCGWYFAATDLISIGFTGSVITPKAVTPGFELGSYPVAGYALTTELYDRCSLEAWADTNRLYPESMLLPTPSPPNTQLRDNV